MNSELHITKKSNKCQYAVKFMKKENRKNLNNKKIFHELKNTDKIV